MNSPVWKSGLNTYIWVFNVGRGLSVFIRTALNQGIMYDLGSSDSFSPSGFVSENILPYLDSYKNNLLAQMILSHPHIDHISEIDKIAGTKLKLYATLHTCPHDKEGNPDEKLDWKRVNNPGGNESKIDVYKSLYTGDKRKLPLQTIEHTSSHYIPNLEYGIYYLRPPNVANIFDKNDQDYTNGVSILLYFRHGDHSILIPGDIPPKILELLINEEVGNEKRYTIFQNSARIKHPNWHCETCDQPTLKSCLNERGLSILLAPHHGLESGYSDCLYKNIKDNKPSLVVISEKRHLRENDGKVDNRYQSVSGAKGLHVDTEGKSEIKYSVTTRNGHHVLIILQGTGSPRVFAEQDPLKLLLK